MEFADCGSIGQVLDLTNTQLTEAQLAVVLGSTLRALLYLHSKKIVHWDIKANNILVNMHGTSILFFPQKS